MAEEFLANWEEGGGGFDVVIEAWASKEVDGEGRRGMVINVHGFKVGSVVDCG